MLKIVPDPPLNADSLEDPNLGRELRTEAY